MNELALEETMTTKEVAEVLGVAKDTINATVERLELDGVLRRVDIKRNSQGGYLFTKQQVTMIKREIQKHHNLASRQIDNATTEIEVLQNYKQATEAMIAMLSAKAEALKAENERQARQLVEQAPKVDFYNAVTSSKDCIDMAEVAKVLNVKGIGRNKLFEILREKNILDRKNQPYQKYVDNGYFRIIETSFVLPDGTQKINLKTVVFQKGLNYIRGLLEK